MKAYRFDDRAGCLQIRRSQQTGLSVGLYHAEQAALDPDGGPWVTICETHGTLINHASLRLARYHQADPEGWCERCHRRGERRRRPPLTPVAWIAGVTAAIVQCGIAHSVYHQQRRLRVRRQFLYVLGAYAEKKALDA